MAIFLCAVTTEKEPNITLKPFFETEKNNNYNFQNKISEIRINIESPIRGNTCLSARQS